MATLLVVAIKDRQVNAFMRPFNVQTRGQANRMFADEVNRAAEDNAIYKHPEDFELHVLGTFEEETGLFTNNQERIALATDHLKGPQS